LQLLIANSYFIILPFLKNGKKQNKQGFSDVFSGKMDAGKLKKIKNGLHYRTCLCARAHGMTAPHFCLKLQLIT